MSDEPTVGDDGLAGKARRLAKGAWDYARSDEARAKLDEVKRKAVEVGGTATTGAKDLLKKTGEAAAQARQRADEYSKSEKAQQVRSQAKGLWDRSRAIQVRSVPWMESPFVIGVLLVFVFPLGLALVWTHPGWSKPRKTAWTGAWAGLLLIGLVSQGRNEGAVATTLADQGPGQTAEDEPEVEAGRRPSKRTGLAAPVADLATADAAGLTPDNVLAALEAMASNFEPFDVRGIDYSKGPNGEAITSRPGEDPQTGKATTDSGYVGGDGQFRLHGLRTSWYGPATPGGERKKFQEVFYYDGQPHGLVRNWYESGRKQSELTMRDGKRHCLAISYFEDGRIAHASVWINGQADGPQCEWYSSGGIKSLMVYKQGVAAGASRAWYPDGGLWYEEEYIGGKKHGRKVEHWENGKSAETEWDHGQVVYIPGRSNARSFFLKLRETATDARGADGGTYAFERQEQFLRVFGKPTSGVPLTMNEPDLKTVWLYKCSDATVKMTVSNSLWFILEDVDTIEDLN